MFTMKCPECRTELPDGANFCLNCGQHLDDIEGKGYLEKAKVLFKEMDLQRNLDEQDRFLA